MIRLTYLSCDRPTCSSGPSSTHAVETAVICLHDCSCVTWLAMVGSKKEIEESDLDLTVGLGLGVKVV